MEAPHQPGQPESGHTDQPHNREHSPPYSFGARTGGAQKWKERRSQEPPRAQGGNDNAADAGTELTREMEEHEGRSRERVPNQRATSWRSGSMAAARPGAAFGVTLFPGLLPQFLSWKAIFGYVVCHVSVPQGIGYVRWSVLGPERVHGEIPIQGKLDTQVLEPEPRGHQAKRAESLEPPPRPNRKRTGT